MADRTVDLRAAFLGNCPDCGTPLERVRKRRGPGHYIWCWKCVRALRMGEAVAAKRKAYDVSVHQPVPTSEHSLIREVCAEAVDLGHREEGKGT